MSSLKSPKTVTLCHNPLPALRTHESLWEVARIKHRFSRRPLRPMTAQLTSLLPSELNLRKKKQRKHGLHKKWKISRLRLKERESARKLKRRKQKRNESRKSFVRSVKKRRRQNSRRLKVVNRSTYQHNLLQLPPSQKVVSLDWAPSTLLSSPC